VAVLLNANARCVNESIQKEIARFIPSQDVYYSRSLDEVRSIVSTVLEHGYSTVLVGGGDGTFVAIVNAVMAELEEQDVAFVTDGAAARKVVPRRRKVRFGILRLGTGNALASLTGASSSSVGMIEDILRARSGDVQSTRQINLIESAGKLAPFAGLGVDALVLGDYIRVKNAFARTPLASVASGVAGYLVSGVTMSVPSMLLAGKPANVRIVNEGAPVHQLGSDGRAIGKPIVRGEVIYQGPCRLAAVGTIPTYGFDFTIFPHALRTPGRAQLRVTAMTPWEMLRHARTIWKGKSPGTCVLDFAVEQVSVSFDRKMPFQIGGDPHGETETAHIAIDPRPIEFLDFKAHG
jgi:diacylglycerol kinase family enzyme